ncbi:MAG: hypothetical protein ACYS7Y_27940 [Planctomycetota bacterium]|jgi:hypothetical protein
MATKAQIAANRRNSRKSTGPRTAEGKEAASQNAFKHGLFVKKDVVRDESQDEYDLHREAMAAALAPVGPMEAFLVQRIVRLTWRLIRAERMQDHSIDYLGLQELCGHRAQNFRSFYINANRIYDDDPKIPREHLWLGRLAVCDFTNYRVLEKMQLYERRLENSLHKTRAELEKLQKARKTEEKARKKSTPAADAAHLKKQSQFATEQIDTSSVCEKAYADKSPIGVRENRPDQGGRRGQFQTPTPSRQRSSKNKACPRR